MLDSLKEYFELVVSILIGGYGLVPLLMWVGVSYILGLFRNRVKVGFWLVFLISLILSPVAGLIVVFISKIDSNTHGNTKPQKSRT